MDALRKGIPNPEEFNPSNQLEANGNLKPFAGSHNTFGWGRRTCIGQPFAERGLYTMISHMLWAFNCTPGPDGPPDVNNISFGITAVPQPFKVNLTPRSEAHVEVSAFLSQRLLNLLLLTHFSYRRLLSANGIAWRRTSRACLSFESSY